MAVLDKIRKRIININSNTSQSEIINIWYSIKNIYNMQTFDTVFNTQNLGKLKNYSIKQKNNLEKRNVEVTMVEGNDATSTSTKPGLANDSALDENELFLEYQPQLDLLSGKIAGFEALIRWRHPELGVINPGQFIGIAEDSGQIQSIGAWVIEKACIDLRYLSDNGFDGFRMSINLSPRQLYQADFADTLINAIVRYQVPASSVVLEITESAIMDNAERGIEALNSLSSLGVSIAIDDFGTGYSSLVALKQYPIDRIKIDQLFVSRLTEKGDDLEIINAVINMAHNLRLSVVAEGVETKSQLEMLTALGCDEIQGFLLGKPLALDAIFEFLKGDEWQESLVL